MRLRLLAASIVFGVLIAPPPAEAGSGGVLATGWGEVDDGDYLKGSGQGIYLWGRSRTVYRWRSLRSSTDRVVPFSPLTQAFSFVVRDDRSRHRVSFETSVRGGADLYRGGFTGEVLYAFVDVAPEGRWVSARLGRQILATGGTHGLTRIDGLRASMTLHRLQIETFAGISLRSRAFVVPKEQRETHETGWGRDWTWGVSLATSGLPTTQVRIGFVDRFRDGQLARRNLTIDVHKGILGVVNVRGNLAVDLLQRRISEALAGVDVKPTGWLRAGVEYEHWQPTFDSTELFSVFNTDPYDAIRGDADLRVGQVLSVHVGGGLQILPIPATKDDVPRDEVGRLSGTQRAGVTVRPLDFLRFSVDQRLVDGTGGRKFGVGLSGRVTPLDGRIELGVRGDLQSYDFTIQPNLQGLYGGLVVDGAVRPLPWLRVGARGETIFSPWLKNDWRISATLDLLLGIKHLGPAAREEARVDAFQPARLVGGAASGREPLPGLGGGVGLGGER